MWVQTEESSDHPDRIRIRSVGKVLATRYDRIAADKLYLEGESDGPLLSDPLLPP